MKRKVAVVFSGCGYLDGSEITEAVSCLIALSEEGAEVEIFAPRMQQAEVNHLTGELSGGQRDLYEDAARIARGKLRDLEELREADFDALVLPGGYGAAKSLSDFATQGAKGKVLPGLAKCMRDFHSASKPIAVFCIAPAVLALALGDQHPVITIGNDVATSQELAKTGAELIECRVDDFVTDRHNKIISSPAYMYEANPHEVFRGIRAAIHELIEMA